MSASTKTILVPRALLWDKLCALYIAVLAIVQHIDSWSFRELCAAHNIELLFDGDGPVPNNAFDVDVLVPYRQSAGRYGSATEKLARELGLEETPGMERLLALLGENNKTGYLREDTQSLVNLIRELFNANPSRERRLGVIELLWPAVHAYFTASEKNLGRVESWPNPFTLNNFREALKLSGMKVEEARHYTDAVDKAARKSTAADERSAHQAETIKAHQFTVLLASGQGTVPGHFVESSNTRLARHYLRQHRDVCLLMVRNPISGNVAIFPRGSQDLTVLHQALEEKEPGLWSLGNGGGR